MTSSGARRAGCRSADEPGSSVYLEKHLHANGTRIVGIFLHMSKDEQRKRFLARIAEPDKNWKLSLADIRERKYWGKYQKHTPLILTSEQEYGMQIQINTGHHIEGNETLAAEVTGMVSDALQRFSGRITRVEVHLEDVNGAKGGASDKRCMLEARLEGRKPIAVTQHAATVKQAVHGAMESLTRAIETTLGRAAHVTGPRA